jgi:hypothetical protein
MYTKPVPRDLRLFDIKFKMATELFHSYILKTGFFQNQIIYLFILAYSESIINEKTSKNVIKTKNSKWPLNLR